MNLFFDTSALIKRYISETGSDNVDALFNKADRIFVSAVTKIEAFSTIKRLHKEKAISNEAYQNLIAEIGYDFQHFTVFPLSKFVEDVALSLIDKYQLKTLDSIQLASLLNQKELVNQFIVSDSRLKNAATSENLQLIDPTES
jgi:hypothetical protein